MNQIDRYKLLEPFYQEPQQIIYMAINKDKEEEVALVNTILRDGFISDVDFEKLVHHLTNVTYYDISEKLVLVTSYNEGTPLKTFLKSYPLESDDRIALLTLYLKGIQEYESLNASFQSSLIDLSQVVVLNNTVSFNEIMTLKSITNPESIHSKINQVVNALCLDTQNNRANKVFEFFNSDAFLKIQSLKLLYSTYSALIKNDDYPESKTTDTLATMPIFVPSISPTENQLTSEEEITPTFQNDAIVTIGLTEIKSVPYNSPDFEEPNEKKERVVPWLWLLLIPIIAFSLWYIFNKEDIPNQPQASFQVVATQNGWMFQSTSISNEPAQISDYNWKIYYSGILLTEQEIERFSFKPENEGQYTVRLVVTDTYLQKSLPYEIVLTYDLSQEKIDASHSNSPLGEENNTPGDISEDLIVFYSRPSSQRITLGTQDYFEILSYKNTLPESANLISFWIKSSDLKPISLTIKAFNNNQLSYETQLNYTPNMTEFQLITHTLNTKAFDTLTLDVQSLNNFIWFDSFALETAK